MLTEKILLNDAIAQKFVYGEETVDTPTPEAQVKKQAQEIPDTTPPPNLEPKKQAKDNHHEQYCYVRNFFGIQSVATKR